MQKYYNPNRLYANVSIPLWIAQVDSRRLSFGAKMTYGVISELTNGSPAAKFKSEYVATRIGASERQVARWLRELAKFGLLCGMVTGDEFRVAFTLDGKAEEERDAFCFYEVEDEG